MLQFDPVPSADATHPSIELKRTAWDRCFARYSNYKSYTAALFANEDLTSSVCLRDQSNWGSAIMYGQAYHTWVPPRYPKDDAS